MSRNQFINWLKTQYYKAEGENPIRFDDGSVITQDLMSKILDALT